jgi:hypothetical protein
MGNGLEEEKAAQKRDLHDHHNAGSDDVQEDDDIEYPYGVQDHKPWTSQGLFQ